MSGDELAGSYCWQSGVCCRSRGDTLLRRLSGASVWLLKEYMSIADEANQCTNVPEVVRPLPVKWCLVFSFKWWFLIVGELVNGAF